MLGCSPNLTVFRSYRITTSTVGWPHTAQIAWPQKKEVWPSLGNQKSSAKSAGAIPCSGYLLGCFHNGVVEFRFLPGLILFTATMLLLDSNTCSKQIYSVCQASWILTNHNFVVRLILILLCTPWIKNYSFLSWFFNLRQENTIQVNEQFSKPTTGGPPSGQVLTEISCMAPTWAVVEASWCDSIFGWLVNGNRDRLYA